MPRILKSTILILVAITLFTIANADEKDIESSSKTESQEEITQDKEDQIMIRCTGTQKSGVVLDGDNPPEPVPTEFIIIIDNRQKQLKWSDNSIFGSNCKAWTDINITCDKDLPPRPGYNEIRFKEVRLDRLSGDFYFNEYQHGGIVTVFKTLSATCKKISDTPKF